MALLQRVGPHMGHRALACLAEPGTHTRTPELEHRNVTNQSRYMELSTGTPMTTADHAAGAGHGERHPRVWDCVREMTLSRARSDAMRNFPIHTPDPAPRGCPANARACKTGGAWGKLPRSRPRVTAGTGSHITRPRVRTRTSMPSFPPSPHRPLPQARVPPPHRIPPAWNFLPRMVAWAGLDATPGARTPRHSGAQAVARPLPMERGAYPHAGLFEHVERAPP